MTQFAVDYVALAEPNLLVPRTPPTGNVRIDTSNEFSRGLELSFTAHDQILPAVDLVSGVEATSINLPTPVTIATAPDGDLAFNMPNNGSTYLSMVTPTINHNVGTGDFTYVAWILRTADTGQSYQGVLSNGLYSPGIYTEINGSSEWGGYWGGATQTGEEWPVGTPHRMCVTRQAGSTRYYRDGILKATSAAWVAKSMSNDVFRIGSTSTVNQNNSSVMMRDVRFYAGRAFSDAEAAEDARDPYQFVTP